nr:P-type DNA transfer ATPase VirB11 [Novosphingobium ovatum]
MEAPPAPDGDYLQAWLSPLLPLMARDDVTDLFINRAGEVWVETIGGAIERQAMDDLDEARLWRIARQIAAANHQGISREHPLMGATLADGSRVQVVAPPATRAGMAIAIRRHVAARMRLGDYARAGGLGDVVVARAGLRAPVPPPPQGDGAALAAWLAQIVRDRRNVLISGGTSSGKTTFMNALIAEIPLEERLILIEDTPELMMAHPNAVGLLAVRGAMGEARVGVEDLLQAALRLRPDRLLLGELRGVEAFSFLRAVNTGHPGSMTTIHADSPEGAVEQLALLALQAGCGLARADVVHYLHQVVDVIVQLDRVGGRRRVSRIALTRENGA